MNGEGRISNMDFFVCEYASAPENICECKICELDDNDSVCIYCKNND